jgi:hypothetical protein
MDYGRQDYVMRLYCRDPTIQNSEGRSGMIAIRLVKTSSGFARHRAGSVIVDDEDKDGVNGITAGPAANPTRAWDSFMRPVHIPKVITPAESMRLCRRCDGAIRFRVQTPRGPPEVGWELTTYNPVLLQALRDSASLRPSYWDPAASVFLTEGYEYFTGQVYVTFSSMPDEAFVVLCGLTRQDMPQLTPAERQRSTGNNLPVPVKPWLALRSASGRSWQPGFIPGTRLRDCVSDLDSILSQKTEMHYPRRLARLGQTIRAQIGGGMVLPSMAMKRFRSQRSPEGGTPPPAYCRLVKASCTTEETSTGRIHEVLIVLEEEMGLTEAYRQGSFPLF